ncbi:MAG: hypothetical protein H7256_09340 [Bdellovibrio sp.]|nr:hypothetical protein [Bdellovibrio sp.]
MRFKLVSASVVLASTLLFWGCSQDKSETPKTDSQILNERMRITGQAQIKVVNQYGEPLAAKILVGSSEGVPFAGNFIQTSSDGVAIIPKQWTSAQHVTIEANGYIRQTLLNQDPANLTIKLNPTYLATRAEVKGEVTSLPVVNGDKLIDFALVMPGMSRGDLLNFDLNSVISPYSDTLTAVGQSNPIPSNVSLPTQKESYFIGVTLSKPQYRMYTPTYGPKRVYAARGRFVFKDVVKELQNGTPFYELINYFSILGGGIRDITLTGPSTALDIPGTELEFKSTLKVQAPVAAADEVLLVLAASDVASSLIPTDIKKPEQGATLNLSSLSNKPAYIISVKKRKAEFMATTPGADRLTAAISVYVDNIKPTLLPLVESPTITTANGIEITLPAAPVTAGINPLAISAAISDLVDVQNGTDKITNVNRRWEILGAGWNAKIQLPNWPLENMASKKRVEINFIGSTTNTSTPLDDSLIQAATHVTHASKDF